MAREAQPRGDGGNPRGFGERAAGPLSKAEWISDDYVPGEIWERPTPARWMFLNKNRGRACMAELACGLAPGAAITANRMACRLSGAGYCFACELQTRAGQIRWGGGHAPLQDGTGPD